MAKLTVDELIDHKFITDASIATALKNGDINLNNEYVKDSITQPTIYQNVYGSDEETEVEVDNDNSPTTIEPVAKTIADEPTTEIAADTNNETEVEVEVDNDNDPTNDVVFTVDNVEYRWEGSLTSKISTVFNKLGIVYNGDDIKLTDKISTLAGMSLVSNPTTES